MLYSDSGRYMARNSFARPRRNALRVWRVLLVALFCQSVLAADLEWPEKARDLMYGESLYYYHQGDAFEALTRLNVAKQRGGIKGHGGHPLLVEGGLMLAYGMTREAQKHFESVLDEELQARVPLEVRNQAWFYLGKVYYLEQHYSQAKQALEKVEVAELQKQNEALYEEWFYLRTQLAFNWSTSGNVSRAEEEPVDFWIGKLPKNALWRFYLNYNRIVRDAVNNGDNASISHALENLLAELESLSFESESDLTEQTALLEKFRLSLGQLYLQQEDFDRAQAHLSQASFDGPFAEQALFNFAIAATHKQKFGLALSALKRLEGRKLFTPWLEQVPYALAYLYEQLGDQSLALQAYQAAAERYEKQLEALQTQRDSLDERALLAALAMPFSPGEDEQGLREYRALSLGTEQLENDAYGRLKVLPVDFSYAQLLAHEGFQLGLRDLHELYKLQSSLSVWEQQLQSFDLMLETRAHQRQQRLVAVSRTLQEQDADSWLAQQAMYAKRIEQAVAEQDAWFFMNEEQMEFAELIASTEANLALLSADFLDQEERQEYQNKLARARAYFQWWVEDTYGANRWAAQKQLRLLNRAMDEFSARHATLERALHDTDFQRDLERRVEEGYARLTALSQSLDLALSETRAGLLALVEKELEAQIQHLKQYRLASRHAIARLADRLYQTQQDSRVETETPEQSGQTEAAQ